MDGIVDSRAGMRARAGTRRRAAVASVVVGLVVFAAFAGALRNGFMFDDDELILRNPYVPGGLTAANVRWALRTYHGGNWHPLTWFSHQLDATVWGLEARGHHLTGVAVHAVNAALLCAVLRALTGSLWAGVLAAGLFGVHPLRVESVVWVSERKDVLSVLFFLLGAWAWRGYVASPSVRRLAPVVAMHALGLTTKAMLVSFPFVLLLLDWWPLGRWGWLRRRHGAGGAAWRLAAEKAPLFALAAAASAVAVVAQRSAGTVAPLAAVPAGARLANAAVSYARYLGATVWPADLSPFYPHTGRVAPAAAWAGALGLLAALTGLCLWAWRRRPWLLAGWLWFVGTLVPVIGIVQVGKQAFADRYTYLPSAGLALALAVEWVSVVRGRGRAARAVAAGAAAVLVLALSAASRIQTAVWRDGVTLFAHAARIDPGNWLARNNLGKYLMERGRWAEAEREVVEAIRLNRSNSRAHYNMAVILAQSGRNAEAAAEYRLTVRLEPSFFEAYLDLGRLLNSMGRPAEAEPQLAEAARLRPGDADARVNLGIAMLLQGRVAEALREYREAYRLNPAMVEAAVNIGYALTLLGRPAEALPWLDLAVRMRPGFAVAHFDRGLAQEQMGMLPQAAASFRRALELSPDLVAAREALARVERGGAPAARPR